LHLFSGGFAGGASPGSGKTDLGCAAASGELRQWRQPCIDHSGQAAYHAGSDPTKPLSAPMPVCSGMGTVCGSGFVRPPDLQFMQCDAQGAVVGAHTQLPRRDRLRYLNADSLSRRGQLKVQQDFTGLIPESESLFLITQLQGEALADVGAE